MTQHNSKNCYIKVGDQPWCTWLGTMAGIEIAQEQGVHECQFYTKRSGEQAAKRLRKHFKHPGTVQVIDGTCPNAYR